MALAGIGFEAFDRDSISSLAAKEQVAEEVAAAVEPGAVIGAGSGSTAWLAVHAIAGRIAAGDLVGATLIPTSIEVQLTIADLAAGLPGLRLGDLAADRPAWLFDGADEVDPHGNLIKGRGGALFREKLMFRATTDRRILVDPSKRVGGLGENFPVPVEVVPEALPVVGGALARIGAVDISIRTGSGKDGPVLTESGNLLLDCRFEQIGPLLEGEIKRITGVVESGLFQGYELTVIGA